MKTPQYRKPQLSFKAYAITSQLCLHKDLNEISTPVLEKLLSFNPFVIKIFTERSDNQDQGVAAMNRLKPSHSSLTTYWIIILLLQTKLRKHLEWTVPVFFRYFHNLSLTWEAILTHQCSQRSKQAWQFWKYFSYKAFFGKYLKEKC